MRTGRSKNVMFFCFLSRTITYLKATEKGGIKIAKGTIINIFNFVLSE